MNIIIANLAKRRDSDAVRLLHFIYEQRPDARKALAYHIRDAKSPVFKDLYQKIHSDPTISPNTAFDLYRLIQTNCRATLTP